MSRLLLKQLLATVVIAAATIGAVSTVSAAPVVHPADIRAVHSDVQPVRWAYRHHHRYWVGPHRR